MKRLKELNGSAAEVEAAFYDALHRADLEALMALWADEEIVCIHPGGVRLIGHAAIRASWETILPAAACTSCRPSCMKRTI
jgi:ketosteroid isomerase-like protein